MPYMTTEQLHMLSNVLCFFILGISAMIILMMKTKRYGRRLERKYVPKNDASFNHELSSALTGRDSWRAGAGDAPKRSRERKKTSHERRLRNAYDTAKRLAERGLNTEEIMKKVNLPQNEIELIVKLKRMNTTLPGGSQRHQYDNYENGRLAALRRPSEKFAHAGSGR